MKLEKKIKIMQQMIDDKNKQIASLQEKNEQLETELFFERNISKEGYEKAKELMEKTSRAKIEYEQLIEECKQIKQEYQDKMHSLSTAVKERNKKIDSIHKILEKYAI